MEFIWFPLIYFYIDIEYDTVLYIHGFRIALDTF